MKMTFGHRGAVSTNGRGRARQKLPYQLLILLYHLSRLFRLLECRFPWRERDGTVCVSQFSLICPVHLLAIPNLTSLTLIDLWNWIRSH